MLSVRYGLLLFLALSTVGCAQKVFTRAGSTAADRENELDACYQQVRSDKRQASGSYASNTIQAATSGFVGGFMDVTKEVNATIDSMERRGWTRVPQDTNPAQ